MSDESEDMEFSIGPVYQGTHPAFIKREYHPTIKFRVFVQFKDISDSWINVDKFFGKLAIFKFFSYGVCESGEIEFSTWATKSGEKKDFRRFLERIFG